MSEGNQEKVEVITIKDDNGMPLLMLADGHILFIEEKALEEYLEHKKRNDICQNVVFPSSHLKIT